MERSRSAANTPENYARAIISLSKRFSYTTPFPGDNYIGIGGWMLHDREYVNPDQPTPESPFPPSPVVPPHDLAILYSTTDKRWDIQNFGQEQHASFFATAPKPEAAGWSQVVFIRGHLSPSWVSVLGSRYNIDPEFFRRHLDFLSGNVNRHAFSLPSLPSSSENIFRLCINTLLQRDGFGERDLQMDRIAQSNALEAYKVQQLGVSRARCGDSVVREYSTICSQFSVVEQWISLCISQTGKGWAVIVCMDHGRPLEESPPGPWTTHLASKPSPLPIIQHHRKMAFRTTSNRLDSVANASASIQQNTAIIPMQYDSLLGLVDLTRRATQDPLSMCIPLFAHAAFSEVQFLNLIESRIHLQMTAIAQGLQIDALPTLQYFSSLLDRHSQQLKDSHRALRSLAERTPATSFSVEADLHGSSATTSSRLGLNRRMQSSDTESSRANALGSGAGAFTARGVFQDFEDLQVRCADLSSLCVRGTNLAMNQATIEESRKGIEQSERVKKLTVLATFFIPLNFCSSLFGMNIDILGQGTVKVWWFFVLCIPLIVLAYALYLFDMASVRKWWAKLSKYGRKRARRAEGEQVKDTDKSSTPV